MKEIQCASSLETVLEECQSHTQNGPHVIKIVIFFFSPSFLAARLGAGAIWSMTH